jgi:hypothetical protein
MTRMQASRFALSLSILLVAAWGCGDDDDVGTEADRVGVGRECDADDDCPQSTHDGGISQECLTQFKGGYCGLTDCTAHEDCPAGSGCVSHDDGNNYCFRVCRDKPECNLHRAPDNEANCSSTIEYVGEDLGKACVPPSGND